uniref:Uncharacterized protein n=1 Tax=Romanomermis culicivorax TaxID=13658 RepID=A0A915JTM6_ROMCU
MGCMEVDFWNAPVILIKCYLVVKTNWWLKWPNEPYQALGRAVNGFFSDTKIFDMKSTCLILLTIFVLEMQCPLPPCNLAGHRDFIYVMTNKMENATRCVDRKLKNLLGGICQFNKQCYDKQWIKNYLKPGVCVIPDLGMTNRRCIGMESLFKQMGMFDKEPFKSIHTGDYSPEYKRYIYKHWIPQAMTKSALESNVRECPCDLLLIIKKDTYQINRLAIYDQDSYDDLPRRNALYKPFNSNFNIPNKKKTLLDEAGCSRMTENDELNNAKCKTIKGTVVYELVVYDKYGPKGRLRLHQAAHIKDTYHQPEWYFWSNLRRNNNTIQDILRAISAALGYENDEIRLFTINNPWNGPPGNLTLSVNAFCRAIVEMIPFSRKDFQSMDTI